MSTAATSVAAIFDPARLRSARQAIGLTKQSLAESVGVSAAAIGQYESGQTKPSAQVVAKLALRLAYPVHYFAQGRPAAQPVHKHFRSLRATTQTQRRQAETRADLTWELANLLERFVRLPAFELPQLQLPDVPTADDYESCAAELRTGLGLGVGPVPNVVRLLESRGVVVTRLRSETERVSAFSAPYPSRSVVVLSSNREDKARSRMDAAHELSHLVLHTDPDPGSQVLERQANAVAAAFLLPADSVRPLLPRRLSWPQLIEVKRTWGVSIAALLYRSRTLGVIAEPAYRRAMVLLGSRHWDDGVSWRSREPGDLGEPEQPVLLRKALEIAAAQRSVSAEDIAEELAVRPAVVQDLVGIDQDRPEVRIERS